MTPAVSIIMPVYNTEKYLREALDTVLAQTMTDIEVLCVNDGSTDSCPEILREYAAKDSRVIVIDSENHGQAHARDLGLQRMTGKWVTFVDSDDLLTEGTLERRVEAAEADDVDILVHTAEPFFESEELAERFNIYKDYYLVHGEYPSVLSGPDYFEQAYDNEDYRAEVWLRLFRSEFLGKNDLRFKLEISGAEDEFFTLLATLYANRVSVLNEVGYRYRLRENSTMTAPVSIRYLRSRFIVCAALWVELAKVPTERMRPAAGKHVRAIEKKLAKLAVTLREQGFTPATDYDRFMFDSIEEETRKHNKEIQGIVNSPSYKIGRTFTAPMRKIRDLLRKS